MKKIFIQLNDPKEYNLSCDYYDLNDFINLNCCITPQHLFTQFPH